MEAKSDRTSQRLILDERSKQIKDQINGCCSLSDYFNFDDDFEADPNTSTEGNETEAITNTTHTTAPTTKDAGVDATNSDAVLNETASKKKMSKKEDAVRLANASHRNETNTTFITLNEYK